MLDGREGCGGVSWERGRGELHLRGEWGQLKQEQRQHVQFIVCVNVIRDTFVKEKVDYHFNNVSLCNTVSLSLPLRQLKVKPRVGRLEWWGGWGGRGGGELGQHVQFIVCICHQFVQKKSISRFSIVSLCNKVSLSQPLRQLKVKPGVGRMEEWGVDW